MGMFKSMHQLHKQAKEIDKDFHPGQMMADGQSRMAEASAMMAAQTKATQAALTGLDGSATISAVRQGSTLVNFQPVVEIDMTVMVPGRMPYPATVEQVVAQVNLHRLAPGASIPVKVDAGDPQAIFLAL
jgi:hypothetical protein